MVEVYHNKLVNNRISPNIVTILIYILIYKVSEMFIETVKFIILTRNVRF